MAKKVYEESKIAAVAEKIREKTGGTHTYTTADMPDGVEAVYDAGFSNGFSGGYVNGKTDGVQSEYDRFWDAYQNSGSRKNYAFAFAGDGWNADTFRPKYDLHVTNANYMFAYGSCKGMDLAAHLESLGIQLDTSACTNFQNFVMYSSPVVLPEIDTRAASGLYGMFANSSVEKIHKLILREDGSQNIAGLFQAGNGMKDMEIEGTIGSALNMSVCGQLSRDSIVSIINALSSAADSLTVTFALNTVKKAFETSQGAADGNTSAEWNALVGTKSNWTISLV